MSLIYDYPPLVQGILIRRYKRFFAEIQLDSGEMITAHCPNTGPMTGIYRVGAPVLVSRSDNPKRKLAYTWEAVQLQEGDRPPIWVGTNTNLPNRVVRSLLERRLIPELGPYGAIRSEVKYGAGDRSRIDFVLDPVNPVGTSLGDAPGDASGHDCSGHDLIAPSDRSIYLEVKNTTWTDGGTLALFPDTVTTRGQKHLRELTALLPEYRAVMLYFINRGDCDRFAPGDGPDPEYGRLLRVAIAQGLEVLPCRFEVTPQGFEYRGLATFDFA